MDPVLPGRTPLTPIAVNIEMWFEGDFVSRIGQAAALGFPAIELWTRKDKDLMAGAEALECGGNCSATPPLDSNPSDEVRERYRSSQSTEFDGRRVLVTIGDWEGG